MSFDKFIEAAKNGDFNTMKIEYQPDFLNVVDENGYSAIRWAAQESHSVMAKSLIRLGCYLDCNSENNQTLVGLLIQTDNIEINQKIEKVIKNLEIAKLMKLTCNDNCDHNFCSISFCFNEFNEGELIDKGMFGKITKLQHSNGNQIFAMKKVSWKPVQNDDGRVNIEAKYVENNINYFKSILIHERIVRYYGAFIEGPKMFIFMDYISGGSLCQLISKFSDGMPRNIVLKYTQQILEGIEFLHRNDILHRDIKPGNVLLDGNGNCKLTDLGFSRLLGIIERYTNKQTVDSKVRKAIGEGSQAKSRVGTSNYMSPEVVQGKQYTTECDIWSLGATVFNMFFGKPPYYGEKQNKVFMKIGQNIKPIYPDIKNEEYDIKSLIDDMFVTDQKTRPSATDLLQKYFQK